MSKQKGKGDASYYIKIAGSLFVIAAVMALLLAVFNALTKDRIAENTRREIESTISDIFADCGDDIESSEIEGLALSDDSSVDTLYEVRVKDVTIGYVAICSPSGFKADIEMAVGMNVGGDCRDVRIITLSETPGVGAKVAEKSFLDGFKTQTGELKVNKDGGTIDAIAGATISSRTVTKGVSDALIAVKDVIGGEAK